jgi:hypothetical protein
MILNEIADDVTMLYRPVGQAEFELIRASGFRRIPPRLPEQPFFYPVLSETYATQIARDWNTKDEASGFVDYVLRFWSSERVSKSLRGAHRRQLGASGILDSCGGGGEVEREHWSERSRLLRSFGRRSDGTAVQWVEASVIEIY